MIGEEEFIINILIEIPRVVYTGDLGQHSGMDILRKRNARGEISLRINAENRIKTVK